MINKVFKNKKVFVGYLTAGDGGIDFTYQAAVALIEGGVDILEIGVPFSDPVADGPIIQRAMQRALANGTTMQDILKLISKIKQTHTIPIVLFSYFNPILQAAKNKFFEQARNSGIDGMLIVDLPFEEAQSFYQTANQHAITPIQVVSPSTSADRLKTMTSSHKGFIYYACQKGTTGVRQALPEDLANQITRIKSQTSLPIVVGFGIGDHQAAKQVLEFADGFVVGSQFVSAIEQYATPSDLKKLAQTLRGE